MKSLIMAAACVGLLAACAPPPTSNDIQRDQQAGQTTEIARSVGMPNLPNGRDARQMRWMYEARDVAGRLTYSYSMTLSGQYRWICDSIGYPISLGTQFSAPESMQPYNVANYANGGARSYGVERLPQAEPNGLHPPSSGDGTMVACINPNTGIAEPQHIEDKVDAFTYTRPDAIGEPNRSGAQRQVADPVMAVHAPPASTPPDGTTRP